MYKTTTLKQKYSLILKIIVPILITQVAIYLISFFDILMSSRYGTSDLAGVSIGSSIWMPIYTGLSGILLAITPIVSQLVGAKKEQLAKQAVQQGLYVALVLSACIFIILFIGLDWILGNMQLDAAVHNIAKSYIHAMCAGLIPLFLFFVLRCFIDALGQTRVTMIITLLGTPINIFLNYIFIFGKFGAPELGGVGAGVATAITYWLIFFITVWIIAKRVPFEHFTIFREWPKLQWLSWKEILVIGVPIGISLFAETSIFSAVTMMMSSFSTEIIAAHQIAINFTSLLYMVPLSISMGVTILVGFEIGAGRLRDAKIYSYLCVGTAILFSFFSACILYLLREQIATMYSSDELVLKNAQVFLVYAAIFQLSDSIQAPVQGALRGYKDVTITFIMAIISYWIIGLPTGYVLANYTDLGPVGYWLGLVAGLSAGAITLLIRLLRVQRKFAL
ncbi:MATE family efflux transporter [Lysinibacillus sphaericus]|uniref:Probable multidrug resistance protein NorM n=2 Tax=Lysinibacillus TaxID=400634 RepID=A0A2S0K0G0_LYSSH|nr:MULTISPECIES: MATE family efflux transporter [Lysinibacillus]AVK96875.1 MATE family efflux transporter [Lysinibacillus sphaericus]MCS1384480.1 MATE family efflux transporter [Lysinibacillus sphaericus]MED4542147.1 MATE family efflux transporter [Lysinibacillus sphaericus]TKI20560.1 MATE family efflux transporter [Lysinibacillus sphaericus]TKI47248.1 MATE family efflux transporter [Lysinibacillus tabacifolii]